MAKQDDKYDEKHPEKLLTEVGMNEDQEEVLTTTLAVKLRKSIAKRNKVDFSDIDLDMEHLKEVSVSYSYLKQLVAEMMNKKYLNDQEGAQKAADRIKQLTDRMDDRKKAENINTFTDGVMNDNVHALHYPVDQEDINELLENYSATTMRSEILNYKRKWGLVDIPENQKVNEIIYNHVRGADDLNMNGEVDTIIKEATAVYKADAEDKSIKKLSRIKYMRSLRDDLSKFADEIVKKY